MAWRTPTIVLSREAVACYIDPDLWPSLGLSDRRRVAERVAASNGDQTLAMALLQGNPNLVDIRMETRISAGIAESGETGPLDF